MNANLVVCYKHVVGLPPPPFIAKIVKDLGSAYQLTSAQSGSRQVERVVSHNCSTKFEDIDGLRAYVKSIDIRKADSKRILTIGETFFKQSRRNEMSAQKAIAKKSAVKGSATGMTPAQKKTFEADKAAVAKFKGTAKTEVKPSVEKAETGELKGKRLQLFNILKAKGGATLKDCAKALDCSESEVKAKIYTLRKKFNKTVTEKDGVFKAA